MELSAKPVEHGEEPGQFIVHLSKGGEPVLLETLDAKEFVLSSLTSVIKGTEATTP